MSTGASRLIRFGVPVTNTSATRSTSIATGWPAMASIRRRRRSVVGRTWRWGMREGILPLPPPQRRLNDLLRHAGVLPLHEVVRRKGLGQRLAVDVVDQEVRGEPLLLELDQIGQQVRGGDRGLGGRRGGGRSGGGDRLALAQPGA